MPQVPVDVRKARANKLRKDASKLHNNFIKKNSHKPIQVLLENEICEGTYLAYTDNYIQTEIEIGQRNLKNRLALVEITSQSSDDRAKAKFLNLQ
jgi:tRNA A37 methylthiotransferase MiaB